METCTFQTEITKEGAQSLRMKIRNANIDIGIKVGEMETGSFSDSDATEKRNPILLRVRSV